MEVPTFFWFRLMMVDAYPDASYTRCPQCSAQLHSDGHFDHFFEALLHGPAVFALCMGLSSTQEAA